MAQINVDDFTFSNATPEMSMIFIGPSRFLEEANKEKLNANMMEELNKVLLTENSQFALDGKSINGTVAANSAFEDAITSETNLADQIPTYSLFGITQDLSFQSDLGLIRLTALGTRQRIFITPMSGHTTKININGVLHNNGNIAASLFKNALYEKYLYGTRDIAEEIASTDKIKITDKYINDLRSNIFNIPVGIGVILLDRKNEICNAIYFEGCRIENFNTMLTINSPTVNETVSLEAEMTIQLNEDQVRRILTDL